MTSISFSVTGEFVTDTARNLWKGGNIINAFSLLTNGVGLSTEQAKEIIFGRKKLVGENELDFVDDDSNVELFTTIKGIFDSFERNEFLFWSKFVGSAFSDNAVSVSVIESIKEKSTDILNKLNFLVKHKFITINELNSLRSKTKTKIEEFVYSAYNVENTTGRYIIRILENALGLLTGEDVGNDLRTIFSAIDTSQSKDRDFVIPPPVGDATENPYNSSGWLSTDGIYYPCGWMEHVHYACWIMESIFGDTDSRNKERELEKLGWLRIYHFKVRWDPDIVPTMKQIDFIYDLMKNNDLDSTELQFKEIKRSDLYDYYSSEIKGDKL